MINQESKAIRNEIPSAAEFWDLLDRAWGTQSCELLRMREQFLLRLSVHIGQ